MKDVADLHALLWYVKEYQEMRSAVRQYLSDGDLHDMERAVDTALFDAAATLLQVDSALVQDSIERLAID